MTTSTSVHIFGICVSNVWTVVSNRRIVHQSVTLVMDHTAVQSATKMSTRVRRAHLKKFMSKLPLNLNLDDLLLDIATSIEPSDADRRIIDKRYRELKTHLERPNSPLSGYLLEDESRIYAQGSISISATINHHSPTERRTHERHRVKGCRGPLENPSKYYRWMEGAFAAFIPRVCCKKLKRNFARVRKLATSSI
jgi:hypothetical protein